ncbi:activator-dependent family glycosyltransferase [Dactylosporangium sp. NBC_01737]|uniref:activator-dependent family glycosyltransferase n=1 Tax=Dactylosporangium sp. NBC_01737 TaxID=2975959 RepID=UPI002E0DB289|nr:activator-dependent family glycosyltransferase [Dactylosporangium sp. NBC_01737]
MRVLLTTYSERTFLQAMVPLAWALRTAGHEVRFASQPELADNITQAGLTAVPVGRNRGIWRLAEFEPEQREADREGLLSPYDAAAQDPADVDFATMREGYEDKTFGWHRLDNFPMIGGLVEFCRSWQPDLVLWEPTTYAAPIAAQACGAAHGRLLWSLDVFGVAREIYLDLKAQQPDAEQIERVDPLAEWMAAFGAKHGVEYSEELITGQFTIDQLPDSVTMRAGLQYLPMQYTPYGGTAVVPKWLWTAPAKPRIALTLGITATDRFSGYAVSVQDILRSLGGLDVEVVATIAEAEQHKLGELPGNVRIESWVPLQALVATCSAVIHHAGPGTLLTVAQEGVPQLTVPWDFDEPELARRVAAQGAALVIHASEATGDRVRDGVRRLLEEPGFRERAGALRDELRAMPTPNQLVPQLEELTAKLRVER